MLGPGARFEEEEMTAPQLSHLNAAGEVHMVEVGERPASRREATAEGFISMEAALWPQPLSWRAARSSDPPPAPCVVPGDRPCPLEDRSGA